MRSCTGIRFTYTVILSVGQSQRLVDGTSRYNGRLEIFYNKTWNTVCNDRMDKKEAQVICKMLGFNRQVIYSCSCSHLFLYYLHFATFIMFLYCLLSYLRTCTWVCSINSELREDSISNLFSPFKIL